MLRDIFPDLILLVPQLASSLKDKNLCSHFGTFALALSRVIKAELLLKNSGLFLPALALPEGMMGGTCLCFSQLQNCLQAEVSLEKAFLENTVRQMNDWTTHCLCCLGQKTVVETNNRHAGEEKLGRQFLLESRALKNTCIYKEFREPHIAQGKMHGQKNPRRLQAFYLWLFFILSTRLRHGHK